MVLLAFQPEREKEQKEHEHFSLKNILLYFLGLRITIHKLSSGALYTRQHASYTATSWSTFYTHKKRTKMKKNWISEKKINIIGPDTALRVLVYNNTNLTFYRSKT